MIFFSMIIECAIEVKDTKYHSKANICSFNENNQSKGQMIQ